MGRVGRVVLPSHPYSCSARFSSTHENFTLDQVFDVVPFFCHKTGEVLNELDLDHYTSIRFA